MNESNIQFDELQQKVRSRWLFWVIKFTWVLTVISSLILAAAAFLAEEEISYELVALSVLGLILVSGYLYGLYRCAYVKPGIKLLLFILIAGGISIAMNFINLFAVPIGGAVDAVLRGLDFVYEGWIFYLNYLLRKVNKSVQNQIVKEIK